MCNPDSRNRLYIDDATDLDLFMEGAKFTRNLANVSPLKDMIGRYHLHAHAYSMFMHALQSRKSTQAPR